MPKEQTGKSLWDFEVMTVLCPPGLFNVSLCKVAGSSYTVQVTAHP